MNRLHTLSSMFTFVALAVTLGAFTMVPMSVGAAPLVFSSLHSFPAVTASAPYANNGGAYPAAALTEGKDGSFYGTTQSGGSSGAGTVFQMTPSGTLTTLVNFDITHGATPTAALVLGSDGNFYGTTEYGGSANAGTVFKMTPSGTLTTLYSFSNDNSGTNHDGANPVSGLVEGSDGNFYGTASGGGSYGDGTVYKITPSGTYTTLHTFSVVDTNGDNSDGATSYATLVLGTDGSFYGTALYGGTSGFGTVFKVTPSGTLTTLVNFTNDNGDGPQAGLVEGSDDNFYGTTLYGGASGFGTVFQLTPSGALTTLDSLDYTNTGGSPLSSLIEGNDGSFYGTTYAGGTNGSGIVFDVTDTGALTALYAFSATDANNENGDGANPSAGLVQNSDGSFYGTTQSGGAAGTGTVFTLTPVGVPTITSFSPTSGPVGTVVTINGTNLGNVGGVSAVRFHDASATNYSVNGAGTQLTVTVPSGAQTGPIGVTTLGGTATTTTAYTVGLLPTITSFTPTSGPVGMVITITGTNLNGTTKVRFHNASAVTYSVNGAGTQITATLPQGAGSGTITVTTTIGSVTSTGTFTLVTAKPPTVTSFTPTGGLAGTVVTMTGTYLNYVTGVRFHNADAMTYSANQTATQLTVTVPSGAATGPITVTTLGGSATTATAFTVAPPPSITSFTPASGPVGSVVTIMGTSLTGTTAVQFQNASATNYSVNADGTQLTVTVPSGAATGPITVTTPVGSVATSSAFTVTVAMPPTITSFTPSGGLAGTVVTITGTNLGSASMGGVVSVRFHNANATTYSVNAAGTQLTVTVPSGAGTGTITVVTLGGSVTSATAFTVAPPPSITSFTPASGPVGSVATITGTNLTGATAVQFQNAAATNYSVNGAGTQLTVTVPSGAATGPITVTTPVGSVATSSAFIVTVAMPPTITSFTPSSGPVGTVITLTGTNLSYVTKVRFHNANAATYSSNGQGTQLTVTVPSGAGTGTITVTTLGGSATSATPFTITP